MPDDDVRIERLELEQFRVYHDLALDIPAAGLRVVGPNGSGKTTLLEAIELLSTTRPRRGANDADLIRWGSGEELGVAPYARVVGQVLRGDVSVRLEVFVERGERRGATRKLLRLADRPRRAGDIVGLVPTVTFAPDDLELVIGSPSIRRRFLDILLSQIDRRYLRSLARYARILSQRNGLLKSLAESGNRAAAGDQLAYWDEQLVGLGAYVVAARARITVGLAASALAEFARLSPRSGDLGLVYRSTIEQSAAWWQRVAASEPLDAAQQVAAVFERQLQQQRAAELARGMTLVGPHRDDLELSLAGHELTRFGSRGQQRIAVLAIKAAELTTATEVLGVRPILLLDDVLSELDAGHREALLAGVREAGGQVFVSATDLGLVSGFGLDDLPVHELAPPERPPMTLLT